MDQQLTHAEIGEGLSRAWLDGDLHAVMSLLEDAAGLPLAPTQLSNLCTARRCLDDLQLSVARLAASLEPPQ